MKPETQNLPAKALEYIQDFFHEDFMIEVKEVRKINGHLHYFVEVSKDEMIHPLHFNEQGNLIVAAPSDPYHADLLEEPPFDDLPD